MLTFEQAMGLTRTVSSSTAFDDLECQSYFSILMDLPANALIVEIGLEYGRSSSIALQVAKEKKLRYIGIDPDVKEGWLLMARSIKHPFVLRGMKSDDAVIGEPIHCILIDGDHSYSGVHTDCMHFLPRVPEGGHALFHDYDRDSLPDIKIAVLDYMCPSMSWNRGWKHIGTVSSLGIFRRSNDGIS